MKKIFVLLVLICLMFSCSTKIKQQPVIVEKRIATILVYHPPLPEGIILHPITWKVFTPTIMDDYIKSLSKNIPDEQVWYAITPKTYESLAYNVQEMKRYILQMKALLKYYRENVKEQSVTINEKK